MVWEKFLLHTKWAISLEQLAAARAIPLATEIYYRVEFEKLRTCAALIACAKQLMN